MKAAAIKADHLCPICKLIFECHVKNCARPKSCICIPCLVSDDEVKIALIIGYTAAWLAENSTTQ